MVPWVDSDARPMACQGTPWLTTHTAWPSSKGSGVMGTTFNVKSSQEQDHTNLVQRGL